MQLQLQQEVFQWAMARSGLSQEQVLKAFPKYLQWFDGTRTPTVKQLIAFAKKTHVTVRDLLSSEPPDYSLQIADFRTPDDRPDGYPSPELYDTVETMLDRQSWLHDYFVSEGYDPVAYVGSFSGEPLDVCTRDEVVGAIRELLGLNGHWAHSQGTHANALRYLKDHVEAAGISVAINGIVGDNTHRPLDPEEFRGFSLSDPYAPVIFINGRDYKSAQIFTLIHELTHLAFAQTGLSNASDEDDLQRVPGTGQPTADVGADYDAIESFCNDVAAHFLVPEDVIDGDWTGDVDEIFRKTKRIAANCKVNFLVVARRARDSRRISRDVYSELCSRYMAMPKGKDGTGGGGGDFYLNKRYRLGSVFSDAVFAALQSDYITYRDAYDLTGLDVPSFNKYYTEVA